jgi:hypothetical protein
LNKEARRVVRLRQSVGSFPKLGENTKKRAGLTKAEILTAEEERNDLGGMLRLKAVSSRFAERIDGMLGAIQDKLHRVHGSARHSRRSAEPLLEGVQPMADREWDHLLAQLDENIVAPTRRHDVLDSFEKEARYESAFRKALDPLMRKAKRYRLSSASGPYGS